MIGRLTPTAKAPDGLSLTEGFSELNRNCGLWEKATVRSKSTIELMALVADTLHLATRQGSGAAIQALRQRLG